MFLNDHVVDFFNGKIEFKGEFSWIYNFPLIYSDFILPTVRKGIVSGFLASSGFLNEDENIEEVANFIDEVCQTYTITTLNSPVRLLTKRRTNTIFIIIVIDFFDFERRRCGRKFGKK